MFLGFGQASYVMFYLYFNAYNKKDWPEVEARIDSVYTYMYDNATFIRIDYVYKVDGLRYSGAGYPLDQYGEEIDFRALGFQQINEHVVELRSRGTTTIRYRPEKPRDSITYPNPRFGWAIGGGFCGLVALLSLAGVITALRSSRP